MTGVFGEKLPDLLLHHSNRAQHPTLVDFKAMEALQIQTPPKDEDIELPELSVPPEDFEIDDKLEDDEDPEPIDMPDLAQGTQNPMAEETRDDEIVVEDEDEGENGDNGHGAEDGNSVLSSPPESDPGAADTSKTGKTLCRDLTYLQMSKPGDLNQLDQSGRRE